MNPATQYAFNHELVKICQTEDAGFLAALETIEKQAGWLPTWLGGSPDTSQIPGGVPAGTFEAAKRNSAGNAAQQAVTRNMGGAAKDPFSKGVKAPAKMPALGKAIGRVGLASAMDPVMLAKLAIGMPMKPPAITHVTPQMAGVFHGTPGTITPRAGARATMGTPAAPPMAGPAAQGAVTAALPAPRPMPGSIAQMAPGAGQGGFSRRPPSPGEITARSAPGGGQAGGAAQQAIQSALPGAGAGGFSRTPPPAPRPGLFNQTAPAIRAPGGGAAFTDQEMIAGRQPAGRELAPISIR